MRLKRRIFLIDVDNTLLDTEKLKRDIEGKLINKFNNKISPDVFWDEYNKIIKEYGYNNLPALDKVLTIKHKLSRPAEIENLFYSANFKKCLNKDSIKVISNLRTIGKVIIFSQGDTKYQLTKIRKSGIEKAAGRNNILIVKNKLQEIGKILKRFYTSGYTNITVIDDRSDVLETAKTVFPQTICIWYLFGKYKNQNPKNSLLADSKVKTLKEAVGVSKKVIGIIKSPLEDEYYQVWKNITQKQIKQVLFYTKTDQKISEFTHDRDRFKDVVSTANWLKKNIFTYTLTDNKQDLLGLIWFVKKSYKNNKYTFGIRTYSSARGKHLAEIFMKMTFKNFNHRNIWLRTMANNLIAIKLYKKFGFKVVDNNAEDVYMVYK